MDAPEPAMQAVDARTPLRDALAEYPALATLLAFRQVPTRSGCLGVPDATLGEHMNRFGVQDMEGMLAWLNDFLRSGEHPAAYLKRWRAEQKERGVETQAQEATFVFSCGCDGGS